MDTKSGDFAEQPRIGQDFVLEKTSGSIATANRIITPAFIFIVAAERNIATVNKIIAFAFIFIVVADKNIATAFVFIAPELIFIAIAFIFILMARIGI